MIYYTTKTVATAFNTLCEAFAPLYPSKEVQRQHAWWILEYVTQCSRTILLTGDVVLTPEMHQHIDTIIKEHVIDHKPLAYIIGSVPFGNCITITQPPVLIPRMETEEWVDALIDQLKSIPNITKKSLSILDLCSGSGCIALALAESFPNAHITAIDSEPHALVLINKNSAYNDVKNVTVMQSDLFSALEQISQFDLIVSNPPYITPSEYAQLDPSVSLWEDQKALRADDEGLAIIKRIIKQAPLYIKKNDDLAVHDVPQLVLEIGHMQGDGVKRIMEAEQYNNIHLKKDSAQKDRIVTGRVDYVEQEQRT